VREERGEVDARALRQVEHEGARGRRLYKV
jgi:hypothetical protein